MDMTKRIAYLNMISEKIIGCAIEVHKALGPGLLESYYEKSLCREFEIRNIVYENQAMVPIVYKHTFLGDYKLDILVENEIIVELKVVEKLGALFEAQLLTYLKLTKKKVGLLLNFNVPILKDGIRRIIN